MAMIPLDKERPDGCSSFQTKPQPQTVREALDCRIKAARENVEDLCIMKAKLETLNVLDHPIDLYYKLVY